MKEKQSPSVLTNKEHPYKNIKSNEQIKMKIKFCHDDAKLPYHGSTTAAGYDLISCEKVTIQKQVVVVSTGLCFEIPTGWFGNIRSRSGLAKNQQIITLGGIIDSDYRGEVKVLLKNLSDKEVVLDKGTKIAQIIFQQHATVDFTLDDALDKTERGGGGFGSTTHK